MVVDCWAAHAGLDQLESYQLVIADESGMGPAGWVCMLRLETRLLVVSPTAHADLVARAVEACRDGDAVPDPRAVSAHLPSPVDTLGPALLFHDLDAEAAPQSHHVALEKSPDLGPLRDATRPEEWTESGLDWIDSPVAVVRSATGDVVAACGWTLWPPAIAHLCVLTHPRHRRGGQGRRAALGALSTARRSGLIAQWRAVPHPSQMLARDIGLTEAGLQLSLRLG